jgi:hypothetical protein
MIVYLHSHDIYDRGRSFGRHAGVGDVVHIIVPAASTVPELVRSVTERVRNRGSIWLLIFNAHGWAARIMIGQGIDAHNVWDLAPLRDYMSVGGRGVEIHACLVASADRLDSETEFREVGIEFMSRLAHVLNAPVRASTRPQVGVEEGWLGPLRGSDTVGVFEDNFLLVDPTGAGSSHPSGF